MSESGRDACSDRARCEPWADGSWWEVCLPQGWQFSRNTSLRGWPYVLTAPQGSKLTIFSAYSWSSASSEEKLVPRDVPPELRHAWLTAAHGADQDARAVSLDAVAPLDRTRAVLAGFAAVRNRPRRIVEAGRRLVRRRFGVLDGFLYERVAPECLGWSGYFCGQGRWLHVIFALAAEPRREIDAAIASSILQSFEVRLRDASAKV